MKKRYLFTKNESFIVTTLSAVIFLIFIFSIYYNIHSNVMTKGENIKVSIRTIFSFALEDSIHDLEILAKDFSEEKSLNFLTIRKRYSQLRHISPGGMELFRLNKKNHSVKKVPFEKLQNKSNRYYFQEAIKIKNEEIYVSPFDFNVENGFVSKDEITFRVIKKLPDQSLLVLNVDGNYLSKKILETDLFSFQLEREEEHVGLFSIPRGQARYSVYFKEDLIKSPLVIMKPWDLMILFDLKKERYSFVIIFLLSLFFLLFIFIVVRKFQKKEVEYNNIINLFENIIDKSAIFSVTDKEGRITYVNSRFEEISGYDQEECVGKTHRLVNSSHHPKVFFEKMWNRLKNKEVWVGLIKNKAKDKSYYWVNTIIAPILDSHNNIQGYASLRFDVTKQIELEENMNTLRKENIEAINRMSANLAHQLGTPLSVIQMSKEILDILLNNPEQPPKESEKISKQLANIQIGLDQISEITSIIKRFGKRSAEPISEFSNTNLADVIEDAFSFLRINLEREGITYIYDSKDFELKVCAHHTLLMQVFTNLIKNSLDEIKNNTNHKFIKLQANKLNDSVEILFIDSGEGIDPEIASKIFDPFFSTKDLNKGTGIGLSFVKEILTHFGGDIVYIPSEGYTTFKLILKLSID